MRSKPENGQTFRLKNGHPIPPPPPSQMQIKWFPKLTLVSTPSSPSHLASPLLQHAVWQIHAGEKSKKGIKFNLKKPHCLRFPRRSFLWFNNSREGKPPADLTNGEEEEKSNGFCFCNTTQRDPWTYTRLTWEKGEGKRHILAKWGEGRGSWWVITPLVEVVWGLKVLLKEKRINLVSHQSWKRAFRGLVQKDYIVKQGLEIKAMWKINRHNLVLSPTLKLLRIFLPEKRSCKKKCISWFFWARPTCSVEAFFCRKNRLWIFLPFPPPPSCGVAYPSRKKGGKQSKSPTFAIQEIKFPNSGKW